MIKRHVPFKQMHLIKCYWCEKKVESFYVYICSKAEKLFSHLSVWLNVPEKDRRDLYDDIVIILEKKEKEDAKNLRKRNIKVLKDILESMNKVTYKTRWSEAQKLLFRDPFFTQDTDLQNMDKEDALIVFEDHIRQLEREHVEDMEKRKRWMRRQERKNREAFLCLLDELHEQAKLTPHSLWVDLFSSISADERFNAMLGQIGSTPLDLFKLYVDDLKARYHEDKKVIKEVLKERKIDVEVNTTYEQFVEILGTDKRLSQVDAANLKLTYQSLMEKAEQKEKERLKEEQKRVKKLEAAFRALLKKNQVNETSRFEEVRVKICEDEVYVAVNDEKECERMFNEYLAHLQEACLHHVKKKKEKKKAKSGKRSRSNSMEPGAVDDDSDDMGKKDEEELMEIGEKDELVAEKTSKKHKKSKKRKRAKEVLPVFSINMFFF